GFRSVARDVATEWLGRRTPNQEREALDREVRRHGPTRLDPMIAGKIREDGTVRIARLEAPNRNPDLTAALKSRARELERLGLAREPSRNVLTFERGWRERLQTMEQHLDIRRRVIQERVLQQRQIALERSMKDLTRGLLGR